MYFHGYHLGFKHETWGHRPTSLYCCMGCYFIFGFPEGTREVVSGWFLPTHDLLDQGSGGERRQVGRVRTVVQV